MRGHDHVRIAEQRVLGHRLGAKDVERGSAHLAGIERRLEVLVDDQGATGDVEDPHPVATLGQRLGIEPALGLRSLRQVQGDEVRDGIDVVGRVSLLDAELAVALGADERIERDHVHAEPAGPLRHELADPPEAEDSEGLLEQLHAGEVRPLPAARGQRGVGLGHVAGQRQQERHRVLGGRDHVGLRGVGHDDAPLGGRGHVDVVDPHAGAADRAQPSCAGDQIGVELGRRADQDAVELADPLGELLTAPVRCPPRPRSSGAGAPRRSRRSSRPPAPYGFARRAHEPCSRIQSMHAVRACTSLGSVAGNMATRSWLRPSLR